MIKENTFWHTHEGEFVLVNKIENGYVHYTINGNEYSCYPEAFEHRFFPTATKPMGFLPL